MQDRMLNERASTGLDSDAPCVSSSAARVTGPACRCVTCPLDAVFVPTVPRQRGAAAIAHAGLQPGQLFAPHRTVRRDGGLLPEQPAIQAHQDRSPHGCVTPEPLQSSWLRWPSPAQLFAQSLPLSIAFERQRPARDRDPDPNAPKSSSQVCLPR